MTTTPNSISGTFEASPGVSLYYEITGPSNAPARILLLHGLGASTENWADVRDKLAEEACVVSLDLKGHGRSSRPVDGDYSLNSHAELLLAFISAVCPGQTVLIAHSYGGAVALVAVMKAMEASATPPVSALILVDVPAYPQKRSLFLRMLYTPAIGKLLSLIPSRIAVRGALWRALYDHSKISRQLISRYANTMDRPGSHYAVAQSVKQILPKDIGSYLEGLRKIKIPTLIVCGDHDRIVEPEVSSRLHNDIHGSSLVVIKDCGHLPQEEQPDEFAAAVKSYLHARPDLLHGN